VTNPNAWYGCIRDTLDRRDVMFHPTVFRYPSTVDLRPHCPPVMDQGQLGSCTAHGITGALRYELMQRAGQCDIALARLQLYYDERVIEGSVNDDAGAEIRDGIKCCAKNGVGRESLWPYNIAKFKQKPPAAVYKDAVQFEALNYERVTVGASYLKAALAQGYPVIIGISVYDSFESAEASATGMIPMPATNEAVAGGHCMYVVGYGQKVNRFTVRNSWGADWGDHGDCYIPEAYLGSPRYGSDYWIIKSAGAHA